VEQVDLEGAREDVEALTKELHVARLQVPKLLHISITESCSSQDVSQFSCIRALTKEVHGARLQVPHSRTLALSHSLTHALSLSLSLTHSHSDQRASRSPPAGPASEKTGSNSKGFVLLPESQVKNLALTVLDVPYSLDSGHQRSSVD